MPGVRVYSCALAPGDRDPNRPLTSVRRTLYDCARPRSAALRRAVAHVDLLCGSPLESALRLLLDLLRVDVRSQVWAPGVGRVDVLIDGWLVVEADGFAFHGDRSSYRTDRRRANALVERGYVLLRFCWEDIRLRPGQVLSQVKAVLARRPTAEAAYRGP